MLLERDCKLSIINAFQEHTKTGSSQESSEESRGSKEACHGDHIQPQASCHSSPSHQALGGHVQGRSLPKGSVQETPSCSIQETEDHRKQDNPSQASRTSQQAAKETLARHEEMQQKWQGVIHLPLGEGGEGGPGHGLQLHERDHHQPHLPGQQYPLLDRVPPVNATSNTLARRTGVYRRGSVITRVRSTTTD